MGRHWPPRPHAKARLINENYARRALLRSCLAGRLGGLAALVPHARLHPEADALWQDRLSWGASSADLATVRAQGRAA